jgi:hypothetical protein
MKNKQTEALEKLIATKDETIKELERQVQLLKNQPPVVITQPYVPPTIPQSPTYPWYQPTYQPYIVTCGTTTSITNDPNTIYTTHTNGQCSISNNIVPLNGMPHTA